MNCLRLKVFVMLRKDFRFCFYSKELGVSSKMLVQTRQSDWRSAWPADRSYSNETDDNRVS